MGWRLGTTPPERSCVQLKYYRMEMGDPREGHVWSESEALPEQYSELPKPVNLKVIFPI